MRTALLMIALGPSGATGLLDIAHTQVAGSTPVDVAFGEMHDVALGWSTRRSLIGKNVYIKHGDTVDKVDDLPVSSGGTLSYLIISAGGFNGIGRHDVAIPVSRIREQDGKIVLPGATKDALKAMPQFDYASDTARRDQFVASAGQAIAKAMSRIAEIEQKAAIASGEARSRLEQQAAIIKQDMKTAVEKLTEQSHDTARKWKQFEGSANRALLRMQQSVEKATS